MHARKETLKKFESLLVTDKLSGKTFFQAFDRTMKSFPCLGSGLPGNELRTVPENETVSVFWADIAVTCFGGYAKFDKNKAEYSNALKGFEMVRDTRECVERVRTTDTLTIVEDVINLKQDEGKETDDDFKKSTLELFRLADAHVVVLPMLFKIVFVLKALEHGFFLKVFAHYRKANGRNIRTETLQGVFDLIEEERDNDGFEQKRARQGGREAPSALQGEIQGDDNKKEARRQLFDDLKCMPVDALKHRWYVNKKYQGLCPICHRDKHSPCECTIPAAEGYKVMLLADWEKHESDLASLKDVRDLNEKLTAEVAALRDQVASCKAAQQNPGGQKTDPGGQTAQSGSTSPLDAFDEAWSQSELAGCPGGSYARAVGGRPLL